MKFNSVHISSAQRYALPALGRGRRSRPTGKMLRRRKLLEMCARPTGSPQRQVQALLAGFIGNKNSLPFHVAK